MRKIMTIMFIFIMSFYGCSEDSELDQDNMPPAIPRIHQHDPTIPDDEWGPDTLTDVDGIYIEWDANQEDDLAGYKIYRSVYPDNGFVLIATVSEYADFYEDFDIELSQKYYYRITAINSEGNESQMSKTIWYTSLPKAQLIEPANQAIVTLAPTFKWFGIGEADAYILRVFASEVEENEWQEIWHCEKYSYEKLEAVYNENDKALEDLTYEKEYRWRVDVDGGSSVGSESNWRRFSLQQ